MQNLWITFDEKYKKKFLTRCQQYVTMLSTTIEGRIIVFTLFPLYLIFVIDSVGAFIGNNARSHVYGKSKIFSKMILKMKNFQKIISKMIFQIKFKIFLKKFKIFSKNILKIYIFDFKNFKNVFFQNSSRNFQIFQKFLKKTKIVL